MELKLGVWWRFWVYFHCILRESAFVYMEVEGGYITCNPSYDIQGNFSTAEGLIKREILWNGIIIIVPPGGVRVSYFETRYDIPLSLLDEPICIPVSPCYSKCSCVCKYTQTLSLDKWWMIWLFVTNIMGREILLIQMREEKCWSKVKRGGRANNYEDVSQEQTQNHVQLGMADVIVSHLVSSWSFSFLTGLSFSTILWKSPDYRNHHSFSRIRSWCFFYLTFLFVDWRLFSLRCVKRCGTAEVCGWTYSGITNSYVWVSAFEFSMYGCSCWKFWSARKLLLVRGWSKYGHVCVCMHDDVMERSVVLISAVGTIFCRWVIN